MSFIKSWNALFWLCIISLSLTHIFSEIPIVKLNSNNLDENGNAFIIHKRLMSNGGPYITNIRCYAEMGGDTINEGVWQQDTDPFLTWEVSTATSNILGYSYSLNSIPDYEIDTTESSAALSSLAEGITYFYVRACNITNDWGPEVQFGIYLDTQSDEVSITSISHPLEGIWYENTTATFNWIEPSSTAPIIGYSYIFDQLSTTQPDTEIETTDEIITFSNISEGIWYFHLRTVDEASNLGPVDHYTIRIDTASPIVTNISCYTEQGGDPINEAVWQRDTDPFLVWEVSTDVSGILGYSWSINNTPDLEVDTTASSTDLFALPDGLSYFRIRACDNAGLWGPITQFSIAIDTVGEFIAITSSSHPLEEIWYENNTATFSWIEPSSSSPIIGYSYIFDQLLTTQPDAEIDTTDRMITFSNISEGIWYFHLRVVDEASNVGPVDYYTIRIDTPSPIITNLHCYTEMGGESISEGTWQQDTSPFLVWEVSIDTGSILGYSWSLNAPPDLEIDTSESSTALSALPEGITYFIVRACSTTNRWGPEAQFAINIDTHGDEVSISSITHPTQSIWYQNKTVRFDWSVSHSTSPIVGFSYVFDQLPTQEPASEIDILESSIIFNNISEGIWYFHLKAIDESGNVGPTAHFMVRIGTDTTSSNPEITKTDTTSFTTSLDRSTTSNTSSFDFLGIFFGFFGCVILARKKKAKS